MPLCPKWTRLAPDYDIVLAYSFAGQNATQVAERIVRITRNPFTNTLTRNCTLSEFSLARLCKSSESLHCPHLKRCKISLWKTERSRLKHYFNQSLPSWTNIISWVNFWKFFRRNWRKNFKQIIKSNDIRRRYESKQENVSLIYSLIIEKKEISLEERVFLFFRIFY